MSSIAHKIYGGFFFQLSSRPCYLNPPVRKIPLCYDDKNLIFVPLTDSFGTEDSVDWRYFPSDLFLSRPGLGQDNFPGSFIHVNYAIETSQPVTKCSVHFTKFDVKISVLNVCSWHLVTTSKVAKIFQSWIKHFYFLSLLPCNITVDVVYQGDCKARVWNNKYLVTITIQSNTTLHDTLYLYLYCPSDRQTNGIASLWLISFYNIPPLNSTYKPAENSYVNLRWVVVDSYCLAWAFSLIKSLQTATTCQLKILLETKIFFWELWTFCRK